MLLTVGRDVPAGETSHVALAVVHVTVGAAHLLSRGLLALTGDGAGPGGPLLGVALAHGLWVDVYPGEHTRERLITEGGGGGGVVRKVSWYSL